MEVKDPVCGMKIDSDSAVGTSEHEGKTYYFCSADCKEEFDEDPDSYVED
ncbi:MAG: YHS domain-containing protein [Thermoleophilia bacterium]